MKLFVRSLLLAGAVAGCNAILDNDPARLRQETATPTVEQNQPSGPDAGAPPTTPPVVQAPIPPGPQGCAAGTHECGGSCAALNDPAYGCGAAGCAPCQIAHGAAACAGAACAVDTCDKGFADCNGDPADGCETDLSKAASCGSCNAVCPAATPVCAPQADSFQCGTGCTPAAPLLCGTECVSPLGSVNHCGGCNQRCPDVPNGTATCTGGLCGFTCQPDFNTCNGACVPKTDPAACGPACTVCPVPANGVATCANDTCGFTCGEGFASCNNDVTDGCEASLKTDPLNCGACGVSCGAGQCVDGLCVAGP
ncbi:MAG: hypothetical protein KIT84_26075 [Labilithrix sp.]|nr:hypothetical protein [Labilithrix sp.]MCW5814523.1 hypothetical protein [Labilithrix sp.]